MAPAGGGQRLAGGIFDKSLPPTHRADGPSPRGVRGRVCEIRERIKTKES
jgi:hypothetical protein